MQAHRTTLEHPVVEWLHDVVDDASLFECSVLLHPEAGLDAGALCKA